MEDNKTTETHLNEQQVLDAKDIPDIMEMMGFRTEPLPEKLKITAVDLILTPTLLTYSANNLNGTERKLLYFVQKKFYEALNNKNYSQKKIVNEEDSDAEYTFDLSSLELHIRPKDLLNEPKTNYKQIKKAFKDIQKKTVERERFNKKTREGSFESITIFPYFNIDYFEKTDDNDGREAIKKIILKLNPIFIQEFLDNYIQKGGANYINYHVVKRFKKSATFKLYEILIGFLSNNKGKITAFALSKESLKKILVKPPKTDISSENEDNEHQYNDSKEKYSSEHDFVRWILKPALDELKLYGNYYLIRNNYKDVKNGNERNYYFSIMKNPDVEDCTEKTKNPVLYESVRDALNKLHISFDNEFTLLLEKYNISEKELSSGPNAYRVTEIIKAKGKNFFMNDVVKKSFEFGVNNGMNIEATKNYVFGAIRGKHLEIENP